MTTHLKDQQFIRKFSYKPEKVRAMEKAGVTITDEVTSGRASWELQKWADWFRYKDTPCFAVRVGHGSGDVKLWIKKTVDGDGNRYKSSGWKKS